jgi:biotin carboxyl carrier protein
MRIEAVVAGRIHDVVVLRADGLYHVSVDGVEHLVDVHALEGDFLSLLVEGRSYEVSVEADGDNYRVRGGAGEALVALSDPSRRGREDLRATAHGPIGVVSVMPGKVARVLVAEGDDVAAGQGLVVVEAMKMENEIGAPRAGRIAAVHVEAGRAVEAGTTLVVLE